MSFFYDLNKKLNGIGAEEKLVESKETPKTPARQTLEQALRSDLTALMEGQVNEISQATKDSYAKKAKAEINIYNRNKDNPAPSAKDKEMAAKSAAKREKGLEKVKEDGTGGANFSGSGSLEEKKEKWIQKATKPSTKGDLHKALHVPQGEKIPKAKINKATHSKDEHLRHMAQFAKNVAKEDGGSEMECNEPAPSKGIPGNIPVPGKMERLRSKRDFYEADVEWDPDNFDQTCSIGDVLHGTSLGDVKVLDITARDINNQPAELIVLTQDGNKERVQWDELSGLELDENDEDIMDYLNRQLAPYDKEHAKEDAISTPYNGSAGDADAYNGMEFEGNAFTGKLKSTPKGGTFELDGKEFTDTSELDEAMTRQHFQHTADLLKHIEDPAKRMELAKHHAGIFKASNPRFDHAKFMKACNCDESQAEVEEGFADMDRWLAQREKEKGTGKFDKRKVSTGTVYTRRFDDEPEDDDDTDAPVSKGGKPSVKRGRGRPAGTKGATGARGPTGKSKLMAKDAIGEEETDEGWRGGMHGEPAMVKTRKKIGDTPQEQAYEDLMGFIDGQFVRGLMEPGMAKQLRKLVLQLKPAKEVAEKAVSKKQQKFMGMVHAAQKGEKAASPEVAKVAKGMTKKAAHDFAATKHKGLPEKVKAKKTEEDKGDGNLANNAKPYDKVTQGDVIAGRLGKDEEGGKKKFKKEEKVDETTTSGSVATASETTKSSKGGMKFGGGIYDSWNRDIENMISENINVNTTATKNDAGEDHESITITVDGDDIGRFKELLQSMGVTSTHSHAGDTHPAEPCGTCGGVPCQCDELAEADAPVSQNEPDYPTNQEESDDALQYSGGLDGPKSTGQTTIPVIANQGRQTSEVREDVDSFLNLYQAFKTK